AAWDECFWQLADTLSLDLLRAANIGEDYAQPQKKEVFKIIQQALVTQKRGKDEQERQQFYEHKFRTKAAETVNPAQIDLDVRAGEENWQQRKERIMRLLKDYPAVFFRGSPGTGKSFLAEGIAAELGFAPEDIIGPVTVGLDAQESNVVGKVAYLESSGTQWEDEAIGRWVPESSSLEAATQRKPRLFIVDEANLTKPGFWNFLRAFFNLESSQRYVWVNGERRWFAPGDRIIFTGNQETLAGRQFIKLIQDSVVTVDFPKFETEFLRERLNEYVHANKSRKPELVEFILQIHQTFSEINSLIDFSLRDIQEFSARINSFT
ncbi:MAG: AAA family ATPase, partial [Candidatus Omnitrophica bacterium]|nr:AAA family ATPase [Candidatus Omnitrophota bacterium]